MVFPAFVATTVKAPITAIALATDTPAMKAFRRSLAIRSRASSASCSPTFHRWSTIAIKSWPEAQPPGVVVGRAGQYRDPSQQQYLRLREVRDDRIDVGHGHFLGRDLAQFLEGHDARVHGAVRLAPDEPEENLAPPALFLVEIDVLGQRAETRPQRLGDVPIDGPGNTPAFHVLGHRDDPHGGLVGRGRGRRNHVLVEVAAHDLHDGKHRGREARVEEVLDDLLRHARRVLEVVMREGRIEVVQRILRRGQLDRVFHFLAAEFGEEEELDVGLDGAIRLRRRVLPTPAVDAPALGTP